MSKSSNGPDPMEWIIVTIFGGALLASIVNGILLKLGDINLYNLFVNLIIILIGGGIIILTIVALIKRLISFKFSLTGFFFGSGILGIILFKIDYEKLNLSQYQPFLKHYGLFFIIGVPVLFLLLLGIQELRYYISNKKQIKKEIEETLKEKPKHKKEVEDAECILQELKEQTRDKKAKTKINQKLKELEKTKEQIMLEEDGKQEYNLKKENPEVREDVSELSENAYELDELKQSEINHLLKKHYKKKDFIPIGAKKRKTFLVRPNFPESHEHTLLVHSIVQQIQKHTDNVITYATVRPDIVFIANNQKYAFEIEMGFNLRKNKKRLEHKKQANDEAYGDNWYIIPYHSRDAPLYSRYSKTIRRTNIIILLNDLFNKH